jgi:hypothetical protein
MYIESVPDRASSSAILLRYREAGKVKKRTLLNSPTGRTS